MFHYSTIQFADSLILTQRTIPMFYSIISYNMGVESGIQNSQVKLLRQK
jgi:hypothetical protein